MDSDENLNFSFFLVVLPSKVGATPTDVPEQTPSVAEVTWSTVEFEVANKTGAGCGGVTATTIYSLMSTAAVGNGRCVEVTLSRIGGCR